MTLTVCIDGGVVDESEARIPVTDRGFLYGDSVYEVIRTYGGRPFLLAEHFERLQRSADRILLDLSGQMAALRREVHETLAAARLEEAYIRVVVTRGSGPITLDPATAERPRRVVIVGPLPALPPDHYDPGVRIRIVATGQSRCGVLAGAKSGNYLMNVVALGEARRAGAHEAILLDAAGRITEGASSNLFLVGDGVVFTPPLEVGILEGITRRHVVALARTAGIPVQEAELRTEALLGAEEVFLTSTLRELLPVRSVLLPGGEEAQVGAGRPGPVTARLQRAYRDFVRQWLGEDRGGPSRQG